jgi:hypothetical protein
MVNHFRAAALGLFAALLLAVSAGLNADRPVAKSTARKLLYPADRDSVPAVLRPYVAKLLDPDQARVEPGEVKPGDVFLRVVSRQYVMEGDRLSSRGWLGATPFVFLAPPESILGRSLLEVFSAIGYSADTVLTTQIGVEKVAILFRYDREVRLHEGRDGKLPEDWEAAVYPTTWDNTFSLLERLAGDRKKCLVVNAKSPAFTPSLLRLGTEREAAFVSNFPREGKQRIKDRPYAALRLADGADWAYRSILERALGATEPFRGDGTTQRTFVAPARESKGFPEFLGPNRELMKLSEVAVIRLGCLKVSE